MELIYFIIVFKDRLKYMKKLLDSEKDPVSATPSMADIGPVSFSIFRLAKAHRSLAASLLRRIGLHPGQEILMMYLLDRDGLAQAELIKLIGFDASTASKMLQRLESEGFLIRKTSPCDKRAMTVHLTDKGRYLESQLADVWKELERRSVSSLSQSQKETVIDVSGRIVRSISGSSC